MDLTPESKARFEQAAARGRRKYLEGKRREVATRRVPPNMNVRVIRGGKWPGNNDAPSS